MPSAMRIAVAPLGLEIHSIRVVGREPYDTDAKENPRPAGARIIPITPNVGLTPYAIADAAFGAEEFRKFQDVWN